MMAKECCQSSPTQERAALGSGAYANMVWIPNGTFQMGSNDHYPEERPVHCVAVDGFWIDRTLVTNAQFASFVAETGYVTVAERAPDPRDYPHAPPDMLQAGSSVFVQPKGRFDANNIHEWWKYVIGADWRHPQGPESDLSGIEDHPVVHITFEDALAYATWADKSLPTEAEWEYAARGGLDGAAYAWGDEFAPNSKAMANTWQGTFPKQNLKFDGYAGTSPVGVFPANGYGLFDMIGNVWEWTTDWYAAQHIVPQSSSCCMSGRLNGVVEQDSYDRSQPGVRIPRKVIKGGSHLCAPNYCQRYRPAARHPQPVDTSTSHVGFRCIARGNLHRA